MRFCYAIIAALMRSRALSLKARLPLAVLLLHTYASQAAGLDNRLVKGRITACGFVTPIFHQRRSQRHCERPDYRLRFCYLIPALTSASLASVKGRITACGFVTQSSHSNAKSSTRERPDYRFKTTLSHRLRRCQLPNREHIKVGCNCALYFKSSLLYLP